MTGSVARLEGQRQAIDRGRFWRHHIATRQLALPCQAGDIRRKLARAAPHAGEQTNMAGYKLATYQTSDGPRAGLVIDDKVFDAAKLTGKGAYATVLGILEDWRTAQGVLRKAAAAAGKSRIKALPLGRTKLKTFDGSCPLGPWIVPASDIGDPQNLGLKLWVNDVLKQDSNSNDMIFNLAEQIEQLSSGMTLHPGDLILTGTPAGVGSARGEFLKAGDVVKIWIEKIGTLTNKMA